MTDGGVPMEAPRGLVYSTAPRSARATDGHDYVIKAPDDPGSIAAEAVAYQLADMVDVPTPPFAIGTDIAGRTVFASRKLTDVMRDCEPWIAKTRDAIAAVLVLDAWLFNNDRNIGGLLARLDRDGRVAIVAIDFEQSWAVRKQHPSIETAQLDPKTLWPRGDLGKALKGTPFPAAAITRCRQVSDETLAAVTEGVHQVVPGYTWHDATAHILGWRRDRLEAIVREVWQ